MLKKFWIFDGWHADKKLGILTYDMDADTFSIELDDDIVPNEVPYILRHFALKGYKVVPNDWSLAWVQDRLIPPNRQLIDVILKDLGLSEYSEYGLLCAMHGKCTDDGCYVVPFEE